MFDLRKLFVREARQSVREPQDPDSDYHPSDRRGEGLEVEYQSLIATQFRRWGISNNCVTIEVRQIGRAPDGFDVFVGMVRLAQWDRTSGLRVLLGLPLLEAKVRRMVRATWLADFSHFGGLWLHASEQLHATAAFGELRELMLQLVPPSPAGPGQEEAGHSGYSSSSLSPGATAQPAASSQPPVSSAMPLASLGEGEEPAPAPAPTSAPTPL